MSLPIRRTERLQDEVPNGVVLARVTALTPLRVAVADDAEVEPVVSQTIVDRAGAIVVGSQVIAAWADNDPDLLIVLDVVG